MGNESKPDLKRLQGMLGIAETETPEPAPFARDVAAALTKALDTLRADGMIEVEDANMEALANEVIDAALESSSLKRLPLRLVKTLIHSDFVEEVYGTDTEISTALRPFLDEI